MKRDIPVATLKEWGLPRGDDTFGAILIEDEIVETGRWNELHTLVFRAPDDDKFYRVPYNQGLTEVQDYRAWDAEDHVVNTDGTVTATEVTPKEIAVVRYVPVEG